MRLGAGGVVSSGWMMPMVVARVAALSMVAWSMRKARDAIADESVAMKSNLGCVDLKALVSLAAIGEVSAARVSWGDKGW